MNIRKLIEIVVPMVLILIGAVMITSQGKGTQPQKNTQVQQETTPETIITVNTNNQTDPLQELKTFLEEDETHEHPYTDSYKCGDFTRTMVINATMAGFQAGSTVLVFENQSTSHAIVCFRIDNKYYFVEPQSNAIVDPYRENIQCIIIYPNNELDPRL